MQEHTKKVCEFLKKAGYNIPNKPTIPTYKTRLLRARLIAEEAVETINALGFAVIIIDNTMMDFNETLFKPDLEKIIDGCCDVHVVTTGTMLACGIQTTEFQDEIDENNLTKVSGEMNYDEYGKLLKPSSWKPPRIKEILKKIREDE